MITRLGLKGNISIHAAREGGDSDQCGCDRTKTAISIHAAREGGDHSAEAAVTAGAAFQSTPPVKAATRQTGLSEDEADISIHAAREGGDQGQPRRNHALPDFNPRRP